MKTVFFSFLLILDVLAISAQERDLAYYLEQAKLNSPLINQAMNDNKIVNLDLQQINRILTNPEINFISGVTLSPIISHDNGTNRFHLASEDAVDYTGHDLAITDGGNYQALVSVKQPLLSGSKYKVYENKADVSQRINSNNISLTIRELEQVVGYQYILCLKARQQADNNLELRNELNNQVQIMKTLVENAVYKQTDLMILQIEAQNYEAEYVAGMAEYKASLADLNQVCGIGDTTVVRLADISFDLTPESAGKSNFLTSYKLDSLNIIADLAISELKYKPQLDLFADAGLNAAYLPYLKRTGLSTGFTLTWNLFDGHQRQIQKEKSVIDIQSIEFEKQNFMTVNKINRQKILDQISALEQRISLTERQSAQYDRLYEVFSDELSIGEVSVMDFKNLVKDIALKKQEILQLRLEKQLLINSYNYLNY